MSHSRPNPVDITKIYGSSSSLEFRRTTCESTNTIFLVLLAEIKKKQAIEKILRVIFALEQGILLRPALFPSLTFRLLQDQEKFHTHLLGERRVFQRQHDNFGQV